MYVYEDDLEQAFTTVATEEEFERWVTIYRRDLERLKGALGGTRDERLDAADEVHRLWGFLAFLQPAAWAGTTECEGGSEVEVAAIKRGLVVADLTVRALSLFARINAQLLQK